MDHALMRLKVGIENQEAADIKRVELEKIIVERESKLKDVAMASAKMKKISQLLEEYIANKKLTGQNAINNAVRKAAEIVPDSMDGVVLKMNDKEEAWFETNDGNSVHRCEGGGFKSTLALMLRPAILGMNPSVLPFVLYDEPLAKLSSENSATASVYINSLAETHQIILIEQKAEIYANCDVDTYVFDLQGDRTTIRKEEGINVN